MKKLLAGLAFLTLFGSLSAQEAETSNEEKNNNSIPSVSISNTVINRNMFFGMNFGDRYMSQPALSVTYKGFTAGNWNNFDIMDQVFVENDLFLSYGHTFPFDTTSNSPSLTVDLTTAVYSFPNSDAHDVQHLSVGGSTEGLWVDLNARLSKLYNSGATPGAALMFQGSVSKTVPLLDSESNDIMLTLAVSATYNNEYFSPATGWSHADGSATLSWENKHGWGASVTHTLQKNLTPDFENVGDIGYNYLTVSFSPQPKE